jgi:hypothetical protein
MLQEHHRDTHTPILGSVQLSIYTIPLINFQFFFQLFIIVFHITSD